MQCYFARKKAKRLKYKEAIHHIDTYLAIQEKEPVPSSSVKFTRRQRKHYAELQNLWDAARKNPKKNLPALIHGYNLTDSGEVPAPSVVEVAACFDFAMLKNKDIRGKIMGLFPGRLDPSTYGQLTGTEVGSFKAIWAELIQKFSILPGDGKNTRITKVRVKRENNVHSDFRGRTQHESKFKAEVQVVDEKGKILLGFSVTSRRSDLKKRIANKECASALAEKIFIKLIRLTLAEVFPFSPVVIESTRVRA
ncbi:MAG: hypothetical protein JRF33_18175 [Deltaproteobacteria bacterium]|nr:hypothetical protein [Deltaproteobacteria bacterium]